jgi:Glucose/sorbosone dehydrogenases
MTVRKTLACLALVSACGGGPDGGGSGSGETAVTLQEVARGLNFPLYVTAPAGDTVRLFVVEKSGRIRIVENGNLLAEPFLDLSGQISGGEEQGLLGLAFHPVYALNGRFFVHYTDPAGDTRVVRYQVSGDINAADPDSARTILALDQPFANHNGGEITFGPDGYLYIALGDGGGSGDPLGNGQDLTELLGSILRIDVDSGDPYVIPPDNPFVTSLTARPEIWSYGLRNPWRVSFDRANGDLYIGDVGELAWEEIDVTAGSSRGGENYGWSVMEGSICFAAPICEQSGLTLPALEYGHDEGCSVTGGYVYQGSAIPSLRGHYFYGDFCAGWVRSFRWNGSHATERREWPDLAPGGLITSFGEDASGELYITVASGTVYRIVPK